MMVPAMEGSQFWTFELVQERLIEAMLLWRRSPGGGAWPFASDGPWHLIRKEWSDWDARDPKPLRSLPLTRDEVRQRDETSQWMALVGERDRPLVVLAITWKARGYSQIPWKRMLRPLGLKFGADGLRMRYGRAIRAIAVELERRKVPVCENIPG